MEIGDKLQELNVTADEIEKLSNAFKDEKFRGMLREYAEELSDPENKKIYEEEIKIMEQERGNAIEFVHPEPFRALRTSVSGDQKCFVNVCANEKVGKPACTREVSEKGQCWSLPHFLHPGRQERDSKGNKVMIYDVIFHPDTLHMATKNKKFMEMVENTAFQGIQKAFHVTLDKNNVTELKTRYRGTPQPCVIRKPIPGYKKKEPSDQPDPLASLYPDKETPKRPSQTDPTESPATRSDTDAENQGPTKPKHTVKYRSFIDLQDYRCSRDSAQSPRPKEIVVTIDLPLLKAARDASLEVEERRLLLESKTPAYRLELPLSYPVDEAKGEAKFNKQKRQLTVTLPVLPSKEASDFGLGLVKTSTSDDDGEETREVEEDAWKEKERERPRGMEQRGEVEDERDTEEEQTGVEKGEDREESGWEQGKEQMSEGETCEEKKDTGLEEVAKWKQTQKSLESVEEKMKGQEQENEEVGNSNMQTRHRDDFGESKHKLSEDGHDVTAERKESHDTSLQCDSVGQYTDSYAIINPCNEIIEHSRCSEREAEVHPTMETSGTEEETQQPEQTLEKDAAFLHGRSNKAVSAATQSKMPEAGESNGGASDNSVSLCSEDLATGSVNREEGGGPSGDNVPTVQIFQNPEHKSKALSVLREVDEHGNEKIISDHSTSAGFSFQNSLMYELD